MSTRKVDPINTALVRADRRLGIRTQRDTDAEIRDLQRYAGGSDLVKRILTNPTIKGRVIIQKDSSEALRINNDLGQTQLLVGLQGGLNPFLAMGTAIDASGNGYTFKLFALRGDAYLNGLVSSANVDISKWYCGCHHVPGGTTLEVQGMPAWTVDGTIASADSASGSWASFTTAATLNDDKGAFGDARFRSDQGYEAMFRVATGPVITNQRVWVGMFASDPAQDSSPLQNFIGFRYLAGTDTNWSLQTGDGTARTSTDSGIAVTADTSYYLRLRVTASAAMLSIGMPNVGSGTVNFTHTTNVPVSTTRLTPYVRITALAGAARSFLFGMANFLSR